MALKLYTCYRCLISQSKTEMRPANKIKGLSLESSRKHKMCKNCKCRVFI